MDSKIFDSWVKLIWGTWSLIDRILVVIDWSCTKLGRFNFITTRPQFFNFILRHFLRLLIQNEFFPLFQAIIVHVISRIWILVIKIKTNASRPRCCLSWLTIHFRNSLDTRLLLSFAIVHERLLTLLIYASGGTLIALIFWKIAIVLSIYVGRSLSHWVLHVRQWNTDFIRSWSSL